MMWHPKDEAEACSDLAAFLEWMRATRLQHDLTPAALQAWYAANPAAFSAAFAAFSGDMNDMAAMRGERIAAMFTAWKTIRRQPPDSDAP
jgi:hypothetical protein